MDRRKPTCWTTELLGSGRWLTVSIHTDENLPATAEAFDVLPNDAE